MPSWLFRTSIENHFPKAKVHSQERTELHGDVGSSLLKEKAKTW